MKQGILAILDYELDYANHLMDYFNRKDSRLLETIVFTNEQSLYEYTANNKIDLLLMNESMEIPEKKANIREVLLFTEESIITKKREEEYTYIWKFQSAEQIWREIVKYYAKQCEEQEGMYISTGQDTTKIIGVFSPIGGSRASSFAIGLGQLLSRKSEVCYINMEAFSGLLLENKEEGGLSELIYYCKERKENMILYLKAMLYRMDGLFTIAPVSHYKDLLEFEPEDMHFLLQEIKKDGTFSYIIFDFGYFPKAFPSFLGECDKLFMTITEDEIGKQKIKQFYQILELEGLDELRAILRAIIVPSDLERAAGDYEINCYCGGVLGQFIKDIIKKEFSDELSEDFL